MFRWPRPQPLITCLLPPPRRVGRKKAAVRDLFHIVAKGGNDSLASPGFTDMCEPGNVLACAPASGSGSFPRSVRG